MTQVLAFVTAALLLVIAALPSLALAMSPEQAASYCYDQAKKMGLRLAGNGRSLLGGLHGAIPPVCDSARATAAVGLDPGTASPSDSAVDAPESAAAGHKSLA
jgi:hypothetical protein